MSQAPRTLTPRLILALVTIALSAVAPPAPNAHAASQADEFPAVLPGYTLEFPRDYGSHPQFRIEWWYLTGWLTTTQHQRLGFQITFFRSRQAIDTANPSDFAPRQLLAQCVQDGDRSTARLVGKDENVVAFAVGRP